MSLRAMDLMRRRTFAVATLLASAWLSAPSASGPSHLAPVVSPNRLDDAPTNSRGVLANFAWRAFIALNWPSLTNQIDAANRIATRRSATRASACGKH